MKKDNSKGFTLVELAVSLVIIGTILTAGLKFYAAQAERSAVDLTKRNQEAIRVALINYLGRLGRLPCPVQDLISDGIDDDRDASGNCSSSSGTVPYVDLGLDRDVVLDGWDNYITYVVSPGWQMSYTAATSTIYESNNPTTAYWPGARFGQISVVDRVPATNAATTAIATANTSTGAAVVLISYGKNGKGALNLSGNLNAAPAAGTDEEANSTLPALTVYKRNYTDQDVPTYGAFDDVVLSISSDDFVGELTNSGTLTNVGLSAILDEARDFYYAYLLSTKTQCGVTQLLNGTCSSLSEYYYIASNISLAAPAKLQGWGVTWAASGVNFGTNTNSSATALTINVTQGTTVHTENYSTAELKSFVSRASGFD